MTKTALRIIALVFAAALFARAVSAAPAYSGWYDVRQPDGTTITVHTLGDERSNLTETFSGMPLIQNKLTDYWEYAKIEFGEGLKSSGLKAGIDLPAGIFPVSLDDLKQFIPQRGPGDGASVDFLPQGAPYQQTGTQRVLVIMVAFNNRTFTTTQAQWNSQFFGPASSLRDYYLKVSANQLTMEPAAESYNTPNDGIVLVTLNYAHPNTGANLVDDNRLIAKNAIIAADPYVNFASFDTDGNGQITTDELHVVTIVAGYENSFSSGGPPSVWGHRWCISDTIGAPVADGVTVSRCMPAPAKPNGYTQFGELDKDTPDRIATIGIICHEMGHDLGFADLYDTDNSSFGVGNWSVMGLGSWNYVTKQGDSPALVDPYHRWRAGWLVPTQIKVNTTGVSAPRFDLGTAPNYGVYQALDNPNGVEAGGSGEYFLIENRQKNGYDSGLPGSGILIWHVDETRTGNSDESRKLVDLEEADGANHLDSKTNRGDAPDAYYSGNNTNFNSGTNPNSNYYSATNSGISVSAISASLPTMTFNIDVGFSVASASAVNATTIDITFSKDVNTSASVGTNTNYNVDNGIGTPLTAVVQGDNRTVRLTIPALSQCVAYTVTFSNLFSNDATPQNPAASPVRVIIGTEVIDDIMYNTTWTPASNPYCLLNDRTIGNGATLTIQAGTVIKFRANATDADRGLNDVVDLIVDGELLVQGTSGSPVIMTSTAAAPAASNYGTIFFDDSAKDSTTISYLQMNYPKYGIFISTTANPTIQNSTFNNCGDACMYLNTSNASIISNSFSNCGQYCVYLVSSTSLVSGNTFSNTNTTSYPLYAGPGAPLIEKNSFTNCPASPISCLSVDSSSVATVRQNRFFSTVRGIRLASNATVSGNEFDDMSELALGVVSGAESATVKENNFKNSNYGIYNFNATGINATHNYFFNNAADTGGNPVTITYPLAGPVDRLLDNFSVAYKTDGTYTTDLAPTVVQGSTLYIQMQGTDADPGIINRAVARVYSTTTDTTGVYATLTETAAGSGIYRGTALTAVASNQASTPPAIASVDNVDAVIAVSARDASKSDSVAITTDSTPPDQSNWNPAKGATIITSSPAIAFNTNESADCKWSLNDLDYDSMTGDCSGDGTGNQSCTVSGLVTGPAMVYIACRDNYGNRDDAATNEHVNYTVDVSPPAQSNWTPAKGASVTSTTPTITFNTDENGDCKWSLNDQDYDTMAGDCTGDGTANQSCAATGLLEGAEIVYIACRDSFGNKNTGANNEHINYTVDSQPPTQSNWNPAKASRIATTAPTITFNTNETADCKWALTDQDYDSMAGDCTGDGTTSITCAASGLPDGATTVYTACRDALGNKDNAAANEHIGYTVDTSPPTQSNWSPAKSARISQTSFSLTLNTGENADCKWALADQDYDSMGGDCTGDGTTNISCAVSGLVEGPAIVYIACRDSAGNKDTIVSNQHVDYTVDLTLPVQSNWNPSKGSNLSASAQIITLNIDENADCKWSLNDYSYDSMTGDCTGDGTMNISCSTSGLLEGAEVVYIACRDTAGNKNSSVTNEHLNYSVDSTPPSQSGWAPAKFSSIITTSPTVTFTTNENADCKWALFDGAYDGMTNDCTGDGTTSQSCAVTGLSEGATVVYVACMDTNGIKDNSATNEHINYTVDSAPPSQSAWNPAKGANLTVTTVAIHFSTNENADCMWSLTDDAYDDMPGNCTGDGTKSQTCSPTAMPDGAVTVYIACKDTPGNKDTADTNEHVNYTIDTTPPVQSNWNPLPGDVLSTSSLNLTFDTNENADCKWSLADQPYETMPHDCWGDGTTSQSCPLQGLQPGAEMVYVSCRDSSGNKDTAATNADLNYTLDITTPAQSGWSPPSETKLASNSLNLTFEISEAGDCKWVQGNDVGYDDMTGDCTGDGTTSIECPITGLVEGVMFIYTACRDLEGNKDSPSTNSENQYLVDMSPPSDIATVRDGLGSDDDSQASTTELSGNWTASTDTLSGIAAYWFAIGTTAGGTDIVNWTNNGPAMTFTRTNLTLTGGATYFISVKAQNGSGLFSNTSNSDGVTILLPDDDPPDFGGLDSVVDNATGGKVTLAWSAAIDESPPITYDVYYRTSTGSYDFFTPNYSTSALAVSYNGLTNGVAYSFVVRARDRFDNRDNNYNEKTVTPTAPIPLVPKPPAPVSATTQGTTISISWTAPTQNTDNSPLTNLAGFNVWRGSSCGAPDAVKLNSSLITALTFTYFDDTAAAGTQYYYQVSAVNSSSASSDKSLCAVAMIAASGVSGTLKTLNASGGTVALTGYPETGIPGATIKLLDGETVAGACVTDSNGDFVIPVTGSTTGKKYTLIVITTNTQGWLSEADTMGSDTYRIIASNITITSTVKEVQTTAMGAGPSVGDSQCSWTVDLQDFVALKNAYGSLLGDEKYKVNSDFNGDQVVNLEDFVILKRNYGRSGTAGDPALCTH